MIHDSEGRRAFVRVLQHSTATEVARVCGVTVQAVSRWATGATRPSEAHRMTIETRYRIHHWAWYQRPI